jgi:predicted phosphoribosyltransferase
MAIYKDRVEAGQKLAQSLERYEDERPIILAMPRGGVVVAFEIAQKLHALLDVIVVRKLGAPFQPEYAIGAIAPNDVLVLNDEAKFYWQSDESVLQEIVSKEKVEMERRIKFYRGNNKALDIAGRVVVIVDDGVATGQSALAAIKSVRKLKPAKIIFAVPVGAKDSLAVIKKEVDEVICLATPTPFSAVGIWYARFDQTEDAEVILLLEKNRQGFRK